MTAVRSAAPPRKSPRSSARPLPQESAGPRLRSVAPVARREIGWRATVVLCVVGTVAALVASVAIQGQRIALQEEADRIAAKEAVAQDRNRDLRIEVVQAESPEHVLEVARASGLVEPGPIAVVPAAIGAEPAAADGATDGATGGAAGSAAADGGPGSGDTGPSSTLAGPKDGAVG